MGRPSKRKQFSPTKRQSNTFIEDRQTSECEYSQEEELEESGSASETPLQISPNSAAKLSGARKRKQGLSKRSSENESNNEYIVTQDSNNVLKLKLTGSPKKAGGRPIRKTAGNMPIKEEFEYKSDFSDDDEDVDNLDEEDYNKDDDEDDDDDEFYIDTEPTKQSVKKIGQCPSKSGDARENTGDDTLPVVRKPRQRQKKGEPPELACEKCDFKSMFKRELRLHCYREHGISLPCQTRHMCHICGQCVNSTRCLLVHRVRVHNSEEHYDKLKCETCGKAFDLDYSYRAHLRTHRDKVVRCTEGDCDKMFTDVGVMRSHVKKIHLNIRNFICDYEGCGMKFYDRFRMTKHQKASHLKIKEHICEWPCCGKKFAGIYNLQVHMRIHADTKPLKCEYCDYSCRQRAALNYHMRKHPEQLDTYTSQRRNSVVMKLVQETRFAKIKKEPRPNGGKELTEKCKRAVKARKTSVIPMSCELSKSHNEFIAPLKKRKTSRKPVDALDNDMGMDIVHNILRRPLADGKYAVHRVPVATEERPVLQDWHQMSHTEKVRCASVIKNEDKRFNDFSAPIPNSVDILPPISSYNSILNRHRNVVKHLQSTTKIISNSQDSMQILFDGNNVEAAEHRPTNDITNDYNDCSMLDTSSSSPLETITIETEQNVLAEVLVDTEQTQFQSVIQAQQDINRTECSVSNLHQISPIAHQQQQGQYVIALHNALKDGHKKSISHSAHTAPARLSPQEQADQMILQEHVTHLAQQPAREAEYILQSNHADIVITHKPTVEQIIQQAQAERLAQECLLQQQHQIEDIAIQQESQQHSLQQHIRSVSVNSDSLSPTLDEASHVEAHSSPLDPAIGQLHPQDHHYYFTSEASRQANQTADVREQQHDQPVQLEGLFQEPVLRYPASSTSQYYQPVPDTQYQPTLMHYKSLLEAVQYRRQQQQLYVIPPENTAPTSVSPISPSLASTPRLEYQASPASHSFSSDVQTQDNISSATIPDELLLKYREVYEQHRLEQQQQQQEQQLQQQVHREMADFITQGDSHPYVSVKHEPSAMVSGQQGLSNVRYITVQNPHIASSVYHGQSSASRYLSREYF